MNERIKKHHIVPKVLQKPFAINGRRIWFSQKGQNNLFGAPELRNIETAFRIKDHYTVLKGDERSDIVERKFYGPIDDYLGKVLPPILEAFENSTTPTFSEEALDSLRIVVVEMCKRTPDFACSNVDTKTGREIVESALYKLSDCPENEERSRLLDDLKNPRRLKEIGRSARVRGAIAHSSEIEQALKGFSVRWAVSETRSSFILSSTMVYRIGNGGPNGLSNPKMEIWMPIAPKVALVLVRDTEQKVPLRVVCSSDHIRKVNEYATSNSNCIASHSEKLLKSLIKK